MPGSKITKKNSWLEIVIGVVFYICFFGSWDLGDRGYIAFKYLQPVSAIYVVPFLVYVYFLQRPRMGPLVLICPILYTIHAILILAGVPIFFTGNLGILNVLVPLIGCAFLAYVICHVYSRYALKKLKRLTHLEGEGANGD
jgi:Kef-type K+ transport system membrane component KefB